MVSVLCERDNQTADLVLRDEVHVVEVGDALAAQAFSFAQAYLLRNVADGPSDLGNDEVMKVLVSCRSGQEEYGAPACWLRQVRPSNLVLCHFLRRVRRGPRRGFSHTSGLK